MCKANDTSKSVHPAWITRTDDEDPETAWGPSHPIAFEEGGELDVTISHHPDDGARIHVDGRFALSIADARQLADAILDLADIADSGKLATQRLRDLIDASRCGLIDADELDAALTAYEDAAGLPVTAAQELTGCGARNA